MLDEEPEEVEEVDAGLVLGAVADKDPLGVWLVLDADIDAAGLPLEEELEPDEDLVVTVVVVVVVGGGGRTRRLDW